MSAAQWAALWTVVTSPTGLTIIVLSLGAAAFALWCDRAVNR